MRIVAIESRVLNVSDRTNWYFVVVRTEEGIVGLGEASLNGYERVLDACLGELRTQLVGASVEEGDRRLATYPHAPAGLVGNTIRSAVRQALVDVAARARGVPAWQVLGGKRRDRVPVYANVNRATVDRSPDGCAKGARAAIGQGFQAVKIAPFDGVLPDRLGEAQTRRAIDAGIERVLAMRDAIGPAPRLMVDCHWRFDEATAIAVLERLAPARPHWFECPVSEQPHMHEALSRVTTAANEAGVLVAACELQTAVDGFRPFVRPRRVDAIMPDVKHCGGPVEMLRIAAFALDNGVRFSPHNPTGPICTMASLHVALAAADVDSLELQVGESSLTQAVVGGVEPRFDRGCFLAPDRPGWGLDLDEDVLATYPYRAVPPGLDERLG
jgi:galactonate dehydratase